MIWVLALTLIVTVDVGVMFRGQKYRHLSARLLHICCRLVVQKSFIFVLVN